ncbi:MAG: hypothetical protein QXR45_08395 [Candidatus Bathyarchaeia archaeon]
MDFKKGKIRSWSEFERELMKEGKLYRNMLFFFSLIPMILLLISSTTILGAFNDLRKNVYYVPEGWENNLYDIISYINQNFRDSSSIITSYALPIAYFTDHPVIEITSVDGIINLLAIKNITDEEIENLYLIHNIRYLLLPKIGHSYYNYFRNICDNFPWLDLTNINKSPYIILSREFPKFRLFKIITQNESRSYYEFLTFFENESWAPLNNYSFSSILNETMTLYSTTYTTEEIVDDDSSFFMKAKNNPQDKLSLSDESEIKVHGDNSIKVDIKAKEWVSIRHFYKASQNWSSFNRISFYFYGANTSKPIRITFHTIKEQSWQDFYDLSIIDDFIGWKLFTITLNSFKSYGTPSWSKIDLFEIGFTGRNATYYLDRVVLEGYSVGIRGHIPAIYTYSSEVSIILSVNTLSLKSPPLLELVSHSKGEKLTYVLHDGVNLIIVPSDFLQRGADLIIYYHQSDTDERLQLYYLGVLNP